MPSGPGWPPPGPISPPSATMGRPCWAGWPGCATTAGGATALRRLRPARGRVRRTVARERRSTRVLLHAVAGPCTLLRGGLLRRTALGVVVADAVLRLARIGHDDHRRVVGDQRVAQRHVDDRARSLAAVTGLEPALALEVLDRLQGVESLDLRVGVVLGGQVDVHGPRHRLARDARLHGELGLARPVVATEHDQLLPQVQVGQGLRMHDRGTRQVELDPVQRRVGHAVTREEQVCPDLVAGGDGRVGTARQGRHVLQEMHVGAVADGEREDADVVLAREPDQLAVVVQADIGDTIAHQDDPGRTIRVEHAVGHRQTGVHIRAAAGLHGVDGEPRRPRATRARAPATRGEPPGRPVERDELEAVLRFQAPERPGHAALQQPDLLTLHGAGDVEHERPVGAALDGRQVPSRVSRRP